MILGDQALSDDHKRLLQHGPRFCLEPVLSRAGKVEVARSVASRVKDEEKLRCSTDCVNVFSSSNATPHMTKKMGPLIKFLSGSLIAVSDKEGYFVILPEKLYLEKAEAATEKNFRRVDEKVSLVKRRAVRKLADFNMSRLSSAVKGEKGLLLEAFFTVKTHKENLPFRTIVSETGTWLRFLSEFLQKHLKTLWFWDPFLVSNTMEVVDDLK